ncbi:glycosyltransferase family 4 protein [Echinicola marina]|nr:glycosyltransferase family 4 protein [Echinicola marina]
MEEILNCDFYFGNYSNDIKRIDYNELKNFKAELKNIRLIRPFYFQKGIYKIFNKYDKFIVLGEYYCLSTWILALYCRLTDKKIYFWTHGWYGNEGLAKRIIKKWFFNISNGVFLYGGYAKSLMVKQGFDESKLHVIYNSLDYDSQLRIRYNLKSVDLYKNHFGNSHKVLIFIGRLTKVKKLDQLLRAVLHAQYQYGRYYNIVFVGTGQEQENLKSITKMLKLEDRVWFYGETYDEHEISQLIYEADICVSPGNVGLTAMHSLVYGTPVLTHSDFKTQMPEFEAIIKGETGDFFEKNNIVDLASKILSWTKNNHNKSIVMDNCFRVIDSYYNPNYQVKKIKSILLNEAVSEKNI